jgi:tetratricopeptide (TPR) repeat protein
MSMAKSPEAILNELASYEYGTKRRRLLLTLLPSLVILAVYFGLAVAVAQRSQQLDEQQLALESADKELAKMQKNKALLLAESQTLTAQIDDLKNESTTLSGQVAELRKSKDAMVSAVDGAQTLKDAKDGVQALASNPESSPRARASELWAQGFAAYKANRLEEARQLYERALAADPSYAPALTSLGNLAYKRGEYASADKLYERALALDPKYAPGFYNRALIAQRKGDVKGAQRLNEAALAARPDYAPAVALEQDLKRTPSP